MSEQTNTREITIQGVSFEISQPYAEGHTVTGPEAQALNQTRAENIRNNMASKVKAAQKEAGVSLDEEGKEVPNALSEAALGELASTVADYDRDYVFTPASAGGGGKPKDPIEVEAQKLAKAAIAGKLKEMNTTVKAYTETDEGQAKYNDNVAILADSKEYRAAAKKVIADREKLAQAGADALTF